MDEYIEREDLLELYRIDDPVLNENGHVQLPVIRQNIMDIPAADVAPVRHARWDENGRCSNCGGHAPFWCMASTYYKSPWCQECGAKMDLEG